MKSFKNFTEALKGNQHKIDKNKNGKVDAHDFKLLRKEDTDLTEATVDTKKYSWGTMKTVHHGSSFSIPLHPEHHQAIAKLKDQQEHKFKTEDGKHWTAKRDGDKVHFQGANNGGKTSVSHSTMKEEVELDEATPNKNQVKQAIGIARDKRYAGGNMTGATKVMDKINKGLAQHPAVAKELKKQNEEVELDEAAWGKDKMANMRAAHDRHMEKALAANKAGDHEAVKVHQSKMSMLKNKMGKLKQNEEVELELSDLEGLDEADMATGGLKDACWKGYTAVGMKMKNGKKVPNCVPVKEEKEDEEDEDEKCEECGMPESECECDHEDDKEEMKEGKHVVGVTISDPGHTMASQRNEKKFRKAKVTAPDKDTAINNALAYYKKRGYKVHDHNYIGLHNEEVEIEEGMQQILRKNVPGYAKKQIDKKMDAQKFGRTDVDKDTNYYRYKKVQDKLKKEEVELDEKFINGREYASQGVMHPDHAKMDIHKVSNQHVDFYASKTGDKMQGKVVKNDGKSVHIQAHKELGDGKLHKFKVTPNLPKPTNEEFNLDEKMDMAKADMGDVIKDFKKSDAPQFAGKSDEKRRQMAIAAKLQADRAQKEEREVKSYKQFMEEIFNNLPELEEQVDEISEENLDEMEFKGGRYVHKGTYGSSYQGSDDDDDDDDKPAKPAGDKRGRGRPKGASSGARQKGSTTGKKRTGVDYTGYPLHLPGNK
jgi:hypothetical protein